MTRSDGRTPTNPGHIVRPCRKVRGPEAAQEAHGPHPWRVHHMASDPPQFTTYWCEGLRAHPNVMIGKGIR